MDKKYTIVNGILIYTSTALLTLIFHEAGHFIIEKLWGFEAVMHPNYGSYSGVATDNQKLVIAAAGPMISLLQGVIFLLIIKRTGQKSIAGLFTLWLSLHGFILFFGYLVCSPFFIYGDTGQVFQLLHFPIYVTGLISIFSIFLLVRTLHKLAKYFEPYGEEISNKKSRLNQLILYPLIIGGIIALGLQLPVPNFLLLFAGVTTPLMFLMVYGKLKDNKSDNPTVSIRKISLPVIVIFILTVFWVRILI